MYCTGDINLVESKGQSSYHKFTRMGGCLEFQWLIIDISQDQETG